MGKNTVDEFNTYLTKSNTGNQTSDAGDSETYKSTVSFRSQPTKAAHKAWSSGRRASVFTPPLS